MTQLLEELAKAEGFKSGKELLTAYYERGLSNLKTAKRLGVCVNTVAFWKQRYEVPVLKPRVDWVKR